MSFDDPTDIARRAIACLDLTSLNAGDDDKTIEALCRRAVTPSGPVAAVCVWARFVPLCRKRLAGTGVKICTVVNFPDGFEDVEAVRDEILPAIADGADEIDVVLPYTALLTGRPEAAKAVLDMARLMTGKNTLKVILETGRLITSAAIRDAAELAVEAGADFLKTSTGKVAVSATLEAAHVLLDVAAAADRPVGVKVAGGVRTTEQAAAYLRLADSINGRADPTNFRFGASGLLDALLATVDGGEASESATTY
ncbi:MAG: deoxyribose-phosphate aldolase [Alphaproteobacteria bacterium]|nr:deoxyribose-phosphate aldolase [Alphaproteobacteria bacterium]